MSELTTTLSREDARALTDEIKQSVESVWEKLKRAYDGDAAKALNYRTWDDYVRAEFQMSPSRSYQLLDYAKVKATFLHNCGDEGPANEAQARPLTTLETAEQQVRAWGIATRAGSTPTAKDVQAAVEEVRAETAIEADEVIPPKPERVTYQPSNGIQYADNAISQLQKIQPNDTQRTRAFERVMQWIAKNK